MQPSENVPEQERQVSSSSVIVTRVIPLILTVQVFLTLVIYPFLPNTVPSHWNAAGQIDTYTAKWVYAGFLPLFSLLLYVILGALFASSRPRSSSQERPAQSMEVSPTQAAALLLMRERTIQQYIQDGKLQVHHLADGQSVVNLDEVAALRGQTQGSEGAKILLKFVMLMQQVLFLIIQTILLLIALQAGSGAAR